MVLFWAAGAPLATVVREAALYCAANGVRVLPGLQLERDPEAIAKQLRRARWLGGPVAGVMTRPDGMVVPVAEDVFAAWRLLEGPR